MYYLKVNQTFPVLKIQKNSQKYIGQNPVNMALYPEKRDPIGQNPAVRTLAVSLERGGGEGGYRLIQSNSVFNLVLSYNLFL